VNASACQKSSEESASFALLPTFPTAMTPNDLLYGDGGTPFVVAHRHHDGTEFVTLSGELDLATVARFRAGLAAAEANRPKRLVIDLSDLVFCDSIGMTEIARANVRAQDGGYELLIRRGPHAVHRVFEITGMDRGLPFE
jgi:anti-sigma B factor antagonist